MTAPVTLEMIARGERELETQARYGGPVCLEAPDAEALLALARRVCAPGEEDVEKGTSTVIDYAQTGDGPWELWSEPKKAKAREGFRAALAAMREQP